MKIPLITHKAKIVQVGRDSVRGEIQGLIPCVGIGFLILEKEKIIYTNLSSVYLKQFS